MQSRIRTVVSPKKKPPSVFKALCFPNTGFMVDFLGFFTRDDFEKYLQLTCKRMNQLILAHFPSRPYRYLDKAMLMCNMNVDCMTMGLSKGLSFHQRFSVNWDPYNRQWVNFTNQQVGFPTMCPFLDKTVRVPLVNIWITADDILTQEAHVSELKSLSHIWENAQVEFTTPRYVKEYLVSCAELLREAKLFRCRRFKCSSWDAMLSLWDYPEIYSLEVVEVNIYGTQMNSNSNLIQLVENRALYPHSPTTFVLTENKDMLIHTNILLQHIHNKFMESYKAQSFQIVFAVNERFQVSDGETDEIRLENKRTQEILHIRHVTYNEVATYCEFREKMKYFVLKRSPAQ